MRARRVAVVAALAAVALTLVSANELRLAAQPAEVRGPLLETSPVTGAVITGETTQTLYVSNQPTNGYSVGDDANDGATRAAPLLTIGEAARRANLDQAGFGPTGEPVGTRIVINDGSFHEFIDWRGHRRDFRTGSYTVASYSTVGAPVPVVFEAENAGRVRIDGAQTTLTTDGITVDYATDATGLDAWTPVAIGPHTAYSHRWVDEYADPIDLGFFPNPFGPYASFGAIARRSELAFIDGRPLRQVLCRDRLEPGTFYVSDSSMDDDWAYPYPLTDDDGSVIDTVPDRPCTEPRPDGRIYVVPFGEGAADWDDATFATTFRGARVRPDPFSTPVGLPFEDDGASTLFTMYEKGNVVVRGLSFVNASSRIRGSSAAVRVDRSRDILFENTTFEGNNWIGVSAYGIRNPNPGLPFEPVTSGLTFRNVTASANGGHGITATRLRDIVVEDSRVEFNNWRGAQGGLFNWDPGNKFMWVHDLVVRRSTFSNNQSHGLWLDTNHVNSTVEDSVFENNRGHGLYLEASIGPLAVERNIFADNGRFESYPGIEGYGIFATFTDNVALDSNTFVGSDIPLVIGGRTEHTHEPISNSYDFETGLDFADTPDDPRGANWRISDNSFTAIEPTRLVTLGVPLENFGNYLPWASDNDWSRFIDTLLAQDNVYASPRADGAPFSIQNPRSCLRRTSSGVCLEWSADPPFTDLTFEAWQQRTGQDLVGSRWDGPPPPSTTTTTTTSTTLPPPAPGDGLANGSFEVAGAPASSALDWTTNGRFARVDDRAADGEWSLRAVGSTGAAVASSEPIDVVPGRRYRLSGWIHRTSDAGQQYIDLDDVLFDPNLGRVSDVVGVWEYLEATWTAPTGIESVRVRLLSDGATPAVPTQPAWFDGVELVDIDPVPPSSTTTVAPTTTPPTTTPPITTGPPATTTTIPSAPSTTVPPVTIPPTTSVPTTTTTLPTTTSPPTTAPPTTTTTPTTTTPTTTTTLPTTTLPPPTSVMATTTTTTLPPRASGEVRNGSFEERGPIGTLADGWSTNTRIVRSDDRSRDGSWSMRASGSSGAAVALSSPIDVVPGRRYVLSGWIFRSSSAGQQYLDLADVAGDPNVGRVSDVVGEWEFVESVWTAPAGVDSVRMRLLSDGASAANPTATAWFDQVSLIDLDAPEPPSPTTTVPQVTTTTPATTTTTPVVTTVPPPASGDLANGSFEVRGVIGSLAAGWATNGRVARSDDRALDGTWSMRAVGSSGAAVALSDEIPVVAGRRYVLSGWIFRTTSVGQQYLDLADVAGDPNVGRTSNRTGQWEFAEAVWVAPTGVESVRVRLISDGASSSNPTATTWFDQVTFAEAER